MFLRHAVGEEFFRSARFRCGHTVRYLGPSLVLDLMAQGLGSPEIARHLHLSDKTVRNHASSVFLKLRVADRAQAIVRVREAGRGKG